LKDNKNDGGGLCNKIHFICLSNARWNQRKIAFKIIQNVPPPIVCFHPSIYTCTTLFFIYNARGIEYWTNFWYKIQQNQN